MKWIAISGSWEKTSKKVESDVRQDPIIKAKDKGIPVRLFSYTIE